MLTEINFPGNAIPMDFAGHSSRWRKQIESAFKQPWAASPLLSAVLASPPDPRVQSKAYLPSWKMLIGVPRKTDISFTTLEPMMGMTGSLSFWVMDESIPLASWIMFARIRRWLGTVMGWAHRSQTHNNIWMSWSCDCFLVSRMASKSFWRRQGSWEGELS